MKIIFFNIFSILFSAFVGFVIGKFLLPFTLHNKFTIQIITSLAEKKSTKDNAPVMIHLMRLVRDFEYFGGGISAALAIWLTTSWRHLNHTLIISLLGYAVVFLMSRRLGHMNLGRTRNCVIATAAFWLLTIALINSF